ncbi:MAG: hypothetical protein RMK57_02585 [Bryobacterales bacterium]|nr:hypothetical protein [Bryobacteraceae bacterium]MDW8353394.1 hypothetical protein [Bryobacterales bacterium]
MRGGAVLLGFALLAAAQTDPPLRREGSFWVDTVQGEVPTGEIESLRISCPGSLSVRGVAGRSAIRYVLVRRVRAAEQGQARRLLSQIVLRSASSRSGIALWVSQPMRSATACELEVEVPSAVSRTVLTAATGSVRIAGLDGAVRVATAGGRIWLDRIGGDVIARTGGGDIEAGDLNGALHCRSGGGSIRARRIAGNARLETAGGEIVVGEIGGKLEAVTAGGNIQVERAASTVVANTAGGLIRVRHAGGMVVGATGSGAITVGAAAGVRAQSGVGPLDLRGIAGPIQASTSAGSIVAELVRLEFDESYLRTHAGDITVYIPSNLAVSVRAWNQSPWRVRQIVSDFRELAIKPAGSPSAPVVMAEGSLNGGGPLLEISAAGGTIYLRRK